jgi:undecaprenyl-diphosphatase
LSELLRQLLSWDAQALEASHALRWSPVTPLFVLVSAWWVKWPLFLAVGGCTDAARRAFRPWTAMAAGTSVLLAASLVTLLKDLGDRARPPVAHGDIEALVSVPASASFPSGHAATAFAGATAIALLAPRLRVPVFALAALVALSRIYLGVHYVLDVIAGSALGIAVGFAVVALVRRVRA